MKGTHFDYIVVGGGSGGYAAARTAREVLENVAIIDCADSLGGLCILRGCMPSKTLIYSAEVLHLANKSKEYGLSISQVDVDMKSLNQRKKDIVQDFADYRVNELKNDRFTLFRSRARFINDHTLELLDGTLLTADYFMIATGSEVSVPQIKGLDNTPFWTSDDVLNLNFLPKKIIILGGGIVSCELAQFLRRIGSEVVIIQRGGHLLRNISAKAATEIERCFDSEGIEIYTDTDIKNVTYSNGMFKVTFTHEGVKKEIISDYLLNALGRKAASSNLGLNRAGVNVHRNGKILCTSTQQTSNAHIYACGDVAGPCEIVHIAILQGELAARHATKRQYRHINYDHLVQVVFTDPQIGVVGLSEDKIKERKITYKSADYLFEDHGKSILMDAKWGYVQVFADATSGVILGAECVSKDAGELIHSMAVAVSIKAKVRDLLKVHWYHPTLSEIWTYPLEAINECL